MHETLACIIGAVIVGVVLIATGHDGIVGTMLISGLLFGAGLGSGFKWGKKHSR